MLTPPLPRNLEASLRDLGASRAETRASSIADLVRHSQSAGEGGEAGEVRARAIPLLEKALGSDEAAVVRSAAAVALGDLGASEALSALLIAVEDGDAHVRQMALNAIGEIGDLRALPRLRRSIGDARPEVRYQGIIAFCRVGGEDPEVASAIEQATHDEDAAVRYIALRIAEERIDSVPAAARNWKILVGRAEALLTDSARQVAVVAAIFLAKMGEPSGHALIAKVVRGQVRADKEDEREAVEVSGELGLRELTPYLERRAWGAMRWVRDTCSFHAKIALGRLGHPRAVAEISRDIASPKREARCAAVVAAGRARLFDLRDTIAALSDDAVDPELRDAALARLTPP